ncbi:MAG TPA: amidohydrolase family protein [Candidatus Ruania gallistercoris]|uniref:Amidohydrolase family protein n=1 Tax=Candidatus Ruania gallistercoris TaxID=2838746 RepID=A0A9D2EGP4_9MICO|nr:amidohydrolase family protein [Candidatus Ruania gallistercoris]
MAEARLPALWDGHMLAGRLPGAVSAAALEDLADFGIVGGLAGAVASLLHDCERGNYELATTLADRRGWRLCWTMTTDVGTTVPGMRAQVQAAQDAGAAAVTLYPRSHDFALDALDPAWELLETHRLPVVIDRPEIEWAELAALAGRHPDLPIVVSWIGYRELRRLTPLLHRHANLHLDTVNFSTHQGFDWFVGEFGAERLLFASGAPRRDPGEAIAQLAWSGLSAEEVELVAGGNARRLFGESEPAAPAAPAAPADSAPPPAPAVSGSDLRAAAEDRRPVRRPVIDAHAHAGPYSLFHIPESDPASMVAVMARTGVDQAVLSTNRAIQEDSRRGNDETAQAVADFPGRLLGYGVVNPWQDPLRELDRIAADPRFVGIKLHPDLHEYPLTGNRYDAVWEYSARTGCPVLTHTWYSSPFDTPALLAEVAQRHGDITVLIGHSGALPAGHEEAVAVTGEVPGAYLELCGSFMNAPVLQSFVHRVGADRVVFGSDFPFIDQRVSLGRVAYSALAPADLDAVLAGNAALLFDWRTAEGRARRKATP